MTILPNRSSNLQQILQDSLRNSGKAPLAAQQLDAIISAIWALFEHSRNGRLGAPLDRDLMQRIAATHGINVIPSQNRAACSPILLATCIGKQKLRDLLTDVVMHAGIHCADTELVVVVTTKWTMEDWRAVRREADAIKATVVVLLGDELQSLVQIV